VGPTTGHVFHLASDAFNADLSGSTLVGRVFSGILCSEKYAEKLQQLREITSVVKNLNTNFDVQSYLLLLNQNH
jgi:hypothetical protein